MNNEPQIITKVYDFLLYLIPQISELPKSQRFLLGERIELASFDTLEILLEACYSQTKLPQTSKYKAGKDSLLCSLVQGFKINQSASL